MKNLAGETQADLHILEELDKAGIEVVEGPRSEGEVPCTLTGKLTGWTFNRAWYYWMAVAEKGKGLPLRMSVELHNRAYPATGEDQPKTYGQVIRVNGDCGCPKPGERVRSYHIDTQEGLNALAGAIHTLNGTSSVNDQERIKKLRDRISALYAQWETYQQQNGVEWLKKLPTIAYDGMTVTELLVAIKGGSEVVSITKKWKGNEHGYDGVAQHFFKDGRITGFNYGFVSGSGDVLNRGPEVDAKLRQHYEELKVMRPLAAPSLELCMQRLETPGSEYKPKPEFPGR